jgi:hypothetical protein
LLRKVLQYRTKETEGFVRFIPGNDLNKTLGIRRGRLAATELRIRAERRLGELLREHDKNPSAGGNSNHSPSPVASLVSRRDFLKLGGAGLAGAFLLGTAGCGGGGQGGQEQAFTAAYHRAIGNLDPHGEFGQEQGTQLAGTQIFDKLVDRQEDEFVPSLATEWSDCVRDSGRGSVDPGSGNQE